jgi:hypothetical protein
MERYIEQQIQFDGKQIKLGYAPCKEDKDLLHNLATQHKEDRVDLPVSEERKLKHCRHRLQD